MTGFGYAGEILKVDLSKRKIERLPGAAYTERFLGGRGMAARLYWDMVPPGTQAFDAGNCLIYATGPVTGFTRVSGGNRWQVCGKSPVMDPEVFSYANLGERWGVRLKSAGYDGLVVCGKADKPVYLYVNGGNAEIRDASPLWGQETYKVFDALKAELGKDTSIITIGPAAENLVTFATMLTDDGASGASGLGSVMGSKNLKAIAVAGSTRPQAADPEKLDELTGRIIDIRRDTWKNWLDEMPGAARLRSCYGCPSGCFRKSYTDGGRRLKFFCQAMHVYRGAAMRYGKDADKATFLAIQLCDRYGLDTTIMQPLMEWLAACYREGVLNDEDTGLPLSKFGSIKFIEAFTRKLAYREGFGELLANGAMKAALEVGKGAEELLHAHIISRANETRDYDPRLIFTNALLYATEPRRPINQLHETSHSLWLWRNWLNKEPEGFLSYNDFVNIGRNFWGGEAASDYSTFAGKALAARKIQDRTYAKESLILCDFLWPIIWVRFADDHTGDPAMESRLFSAITGKDVDEAGLNKIGERIFNLQRAIFLRDGWKGRRDDNLLDYLHDEPLQFVFFNPDCIVPGKNGEVVSRKGGRLPREDFEKLKDEYYELRGWDVESGLPTEKKLGELGLSDIASDLKQRELLR
jgi:aldehyde:ferredoxin oxidoreductase